MSIRALEFLRHFARIFIAPIMHEKGGKLPYKHLTGKKSSVGNPLETVSESVKFLSAN